MSPKTAAKNTAPKSAAPQSFESALRELEALVNKLESGEITLEESLAAYRRGSELTRYCQQFLSQAEQVILQLDKDQLKPQLDRPPPGRLPDNDGDE